MLGSRKLTEINATDVERLLFSLQEKKGLSNKSVNNILGSLRIILEESYRQGLIPENPASKVSPLPDSYNHRGILTPEEVKRLFFSPTLFPHLVALCH